MVLDGDAREVLGIGFVGVKGFAGGFGERALDPWGEQMIKSFVHEAIAEASQYRDDVETWGYGDARLQPHGSQWTAANEE